MGSPWYGMTWQERFWLKVDRDESEDGCWDWTAGLNAYGSGHFCQWPGSGNQSHRIAYQLGCGPIPVDENGKTFVVYQTCRNRKCCRPSHLSVMPDIEYRKFVAEEKLEARFWSKVRKGLGEDDCWEWVGHKSDGYGYMAARGSYMKMHRLSWEMAYGEIPKGEGPHGTCVLHRCDNRACVRPSHLFLGTNLDNVRDKMMKGRHVAAKGEHHSMAKLTESDVLKIRADAGKTHAQFARELGVSETTIQNIRNGKLWKHIGSGAITE